jgi:aspartate/methionine/tyrosine aminotransferase
MERARATVTPTRLSKKALDLKRSKSPVRQIMDYASPAYFRKVGLDPAQVISFAGGWVNHEAPDALRECYVRIASDPELFHQSGAYGPTLGREDCRQALVDAERHVFGMTELDASQVAIGASSTQLTSTLMSVLLDPGDAIALLDPSYCNFPIQILTAQDVRILRFPVLEPVSWTYVAEERAADFAAFIREEKPRVVLLVSPDNPTSQVPSDAFVEHALEAVREVGGVLVVDFAYKELVFGGPYPRYFSWGPSEHFLSIHSNSKWCRGLGRRLGWVEAAAPVIDALESLQGAQALCPDTLHQMALAEYLGPAIANGSLAAYLADAKRRYAEAARVAVEAIREHTELPCLVPQGGLYTCLRVGSDGATFVENALREAGVLLVPGWGFGRTLRDGVRLSFGPLVRHLDRIREGMGRLGSYLRR